MFDKKSAIQLMKLLPPDYPIRIAFELREESKVSPQFIRKVVNGEEIDKEIFKAVQRLIEIVEASGSAEPIFPKKHILKIQAALQSKNISVNDRYVRMIISGDRENAEILTAVFKIIEQYKAEVRETQKKVMDLIKK